MTRIMYLFKMRIICDSVKSKVGIEPKLLVLREIANAKARAIYNYNRYPVEGKLAELPLSYKEISQYLVLHSFFPPNIVGC